MIVEANERKAFEYDFVTRKCNSRAMLERDPDSPEKYAHPATRLSWGGWMAGVQSFAKRKGLGSADS